ncbi:MAG: DUF5615 family PIN-like protein [Alphaproteobacteria bacterium]|nr:DUF5615 family PIN-like protein [Alphaproteobacteria bacterium]
MIGLFADECVRADPIAALRHAGFDVRLLDDDQRAARDEDVLATANALRRVPITEDKDFGEPTIRFRRRAMGIVLLRIDWRGGSDGVRAIADRLWTVSHRPAGNYTTVGPAGIRFAPLPAAL